MKKNKPYKGTDEKETKTPVWEKNFLEKLNNSGKWRTDAPDLMYDAYIVLYSEDHPFGPHPQFDRIKV